MMNEKNENRNKIQYNHAYTYRHTDIWNQHARTPRNRWLHTFLELIYNYFEVMDIGLALTQPWCLEWQAAWCRDSCRQRGSAPSWGSGRNPGAGTASACGLAPCGQAFCICRGRKGIFRLYIRLEGPRHSLDYMLFLLTVFLNKRNKHFTYLRI